MYNYLYRLLQQKNNFFHSQKDDGPLAAQIGKTQDNKRVKVDIKNHLILNLDLWRIMIIL